MCCACQCYPGGEATNTRHQSNASALGLCDESFDLLLSTYELDWLWTPQTPLLFSPSPYLLTRLHLLLTSGMPSIGSA